MKRKLATTGAVSRSGTFKRRKAGRSRPGSTTFSRTVIGDLTKVQLRYVTQFALTSSLGVTSQHTFRGNGLFDPDVAVGGHQPAGFDQWAAFYRSYKVFASSIKVTVNANGSGTAATTIAAAIVPNVTSTSLGLGVRTIAENGQSVFGVGGASGQAPLVLTNYRTSKKMFARDIRNERDCGALTSADPAAGWFWHLAFQVNDAATTMDSIVTVEIKYWAEFYERSVQDLS